MRNDRPSLGAMTLIVTMCSGAVGCSLIRDFTVFEGDAGTSDDAGSADAGEVDGGADDAGPMDAAIQDGSVTGDAGGDAATPDSGVDAGPADAGPPMCGWGAFDGASYITATGLTLSDSAHTVEAWIRIDSSVSSSTIVSIGRLTFTVTPNNVGGDLFVQHTAHNALRAPATANQLGDDAWHHVAYTYNGGGYSSISSWAYWIDGTRHNPTMFEGNASRNPLPTSGETTVGREPTESSPAFRYMNGDIRELRISSGARYTTPFTPAIVLAADGTTVALWHLSDIVAGAAPEATGSFAGTVTGVVSTLGDCPVSR